MLIWKALQVTEKVLAKCGLNGTKSSISTKRSECFFDYANLQKKAELKSMSGIENLLFNFTLNPAFCQYYVSVAQLLSLI